MSIEPNIERVTRDQIEHLIPAAEMEDLIFSDNVDYYALRERRPSGERPIVGICGIRWYARKAVFKNVYVVPERRRRGLFRAMFWARAEIAYRAGVKYIEANCTPSSFPYYRQMGAEVMQAYSNGVTRVALPIGRLGIGE